MISTNFNGIHWFKYHGAFIPDAPPHHNITLSSEEQKDLLKKSGAYFLRWTSDFDLPVETQFWYIIKDKTEVLETYSSKIRNQIKKGLKHCEVIRISSETLQYEGYLPYQKALLSYGVSDIPNEKIFKEEIQSLGVDWEFWGIYSVSGKMIGYAQNRIIDDTCNYSTVKFHPDFLTFYPGYALFFTMNRYYLNERKMRYVHDGSRSLSHESNIQDFLYTKFKFRKAYCRMHIRYRNDIALAVRLLFPFQSIFEKIPFAPIKKITTLLKHEEIRRSYGQ